MTLAITTLGTLAVTSGGQPIKGFRSAKIQALLVYLAVESGYPHRREALADLLWSGQDPKSANTNFRQALSRLQRALGNKTASPPFLTITRQTVQWNSESDYTLDVDVMRDALTDPETDAAVQQALAQYQGDFLAGFFVTEAPAFDHWAAVTREKMHQTLLAGLAQASDLAAGRGEFDRVAAYARRQLALTPWDEAAHRALMQALAMQGQRNEALAQFDRCYEVLEQELGVEPSDETLALYEQIATGVIVPESETAPSLPQPPTPFIGRVAEISHIIRTLSRPACRILTLTGAGGVGKTRLALAVAEQMQSRLGREVAFVSLVGVSTTAQAQAALAQALDVTLLDPAMVAAQLADVVSRRAPLLVFDNCEPLLAADGADFVRWLAALVTAAPESRVMATSRRSMQSLMEWVLPIGGMALPPAAEALAPDQWHQFDAIALFAQQAQQTRVTFALTAHNIGDVVRLCRLVNGLPLGIELAAAQLRHHTVAEVVAELAQNPNVLHADLHDLPWRHRSLDKVFAHSWDLLSAEERAALVQCAVFVGGFGRAAAGAVLGEGALLLDGLLEQALLTRRETSTGPTHVWYQLPNLLRAWLLAEKELALETRDRHAAYYLSWVSAHRALLPLEYDNIAAAWAWAQQRDNVPVPSGWQPAWLEEDLPDSNAGTEGYLPGVGQHAPLLIGREQELAQLWDALQPVLDDGKNGGLITITGEAGIGKSYLVAELSSELAHAAWFTCPTDEGSAQALLPFRTWLAEYFGQEEGASFPKNRQVFDARFDDLVQATTDREAAAELDRLYSFLAALVNIVLPDTLYSRSRPKQRREHFQQAIKALIKAESRLQPVILHIEDGHWLDTDSADLVASLLHNVGNYPFVIIVTARPNQYKPPLLIDLPQHTIRLEPLTKEAITQLAFSRLNHRPDPALVTWLHNHGGGNPFFTEQLLFYLDDYGLVANGKLLHTDLALADSRLPLDVHNVLAARLTHLAPATREIVAQAAVLGREFSLPVLRRLVGEEETLRVGLSAGEGAAIWHPLSADRYAFNHALLHDTAYHVQFAAERSDLHREAARAVAAVATPEQPQYAAIAHHLEEATERRRAAGNYLKAGDEARDRYFIREAHNHYSRGLALAETDAQRLALYLGREQVNYWLGNRELQKEDLRQLVGLTTHSKDNHLLAEITLRRATYALATAEYEQAIHHAQRATSLAAAIPDRLLEARAYRRWGRALWQQGKAKSAEPLLKRARRLAQLSADATEMALCTYDLATVAFYIARYDIAQTEFEQAKTEFAAIDDRHNYIRCVDALGQVAVNQHRFEVAIAHFERVITLSRNVDWTYHEMYGYAHLGDCYFELGRYARCRKLHRQAVALARVLDETRAEAVSYDTIGLAFYCENRLQEARSQLEMAVSLFERRNFAADKAFALTHLGLTLADLEETEQAGVCLYDALSIRAQSGVEAATIDTEAALGWLDMARGDTALAVERAREVAAWLRINGTVGIELPLLVYHQCHTILRMAGRPEEAEQVIRDAYTLLQELAHGIEDETLRDSFLNNVPYHRHIIAAWSVL